MGREAHPSGEEKFAGKHAYFSATSAPKMLDPDQAFAALAGTRFGGLRGNSRMLKGLTTLKRCWNFGE
jgi:hypothetical protein